ncbi:MAG: hypothetical protein JSR49_09405 [Proteobacteria bacterium]|nr:hypothetical protein [Pseudomonadota bacterium]
MNREQLHALLGKAKARIAHAEFVIVGSLAILGAVKQPPNTMVTSIDVDAFLKNDPKRTGELAEALGQGSAFEDEFGYYLDPVSPNLPSFPEGWRGRLTLLDFGDVKAFFVDPNDVAVSKYIRGEDRDLRWLRAGLQAGLLDMTIIEHRIASAPALDGELDAARKRMARHKKRLKLA